VHVKAVLGRTVSSVLTSAALRKAQRASASLLRRLAGGTAHVHYFHQVDDPYSHLAAQTLARLTARYRIELVAHLVPPPSAAAAPDRTRLESWSRRDAAALARRLDLDAPDALQPPDAGLVELASVALAAAIERREFATAAAGISKALWHGDRAALAHAAATVPGGSAETALRTGDALRTRRGHYLGATFHFGGEWYWGVDRLHYLEDRLRNEGLARESSGSPIAPVRDVTMPLLPATPDRSEPRPTLDFFCSLRSPYTYLAMPRVRRLADHYGAGLRLRFVLPMVMRGLPVPLAKRMYILRDARREADRLGMRFGRLVDPVGRPTERGLAVLHHAIPAGKGPAFAESFLQGVFADGIDAGSESGLQHLAQRAGLDAAFVATAIRDESWRAVAAANREELLALGLWGVPSFRVDSGPAHWGQDRLWAIEETLAAGRNAPPRR
jgi:2-hydroxychromene-2-carboxylate isomerase